jgi:hypothetical protein
LKTDGHEPAAGERATVFHVEEDRPVPAGWAASQSLEERGRRANHGESIMTDGYRS